MLEARCPFGDNGHMKIFLLESLPQWSMGEQSARLHRASAIKKDGPTWGRKDRHHQDEVECIRQGFILDRFSLLPVSCVSFETGL
jgi:hypothetical protein